MRPAQEPLPDTLDAAFARPLKTWLDTLALERGLSRLSLAAYRTDLIQFCTFFQETGRNGLADLDFSDVLNWQEDLYQRGYEPATKSRKITSMQGFVRFLEKQGVVREGLTARLSRPQQKRRLPKVISEEHLRQLLGFDHGDDELALRDKAALELLYGSGLRVSELAGLTPHMLNLHEGTVRVTGKRNKTRTVPLTPVTVSALGAYHQKRAQRLGKGVAAALTLPVLTDLKDKPLSRQALWGMVKKRALEAGLPIKVHPHLFRHSFATHLLDHDADLRSVQEMLGHASLTTTEIYTHVSHAKLKAAFAKAHPRYSIQG